MFIVYKQLSSIQSVMLQNMEELCVYVLFWIWSESYTFKSNITQTLINLIA